jgi:hypothetical protein
MKRKPNPGEVSHREVTVMFNLYNGERRFYTWTSPLSMGRAITRVKGLAVRQLSIERVPGRSRIALMQITAVEIDRPWPKYKAPRRPGRVSLLDAACGGDTSFGQRRAKKAGAA